MGAAKAMRCVAAVVLAVAASLPAGAAPASPEQLAAVYRSQVDRRLEVPEADARLYGHLAEQAFVAAGMRPAPAQYVAVVDRSPQVQALLLFWRSAAGDWRLVGASPVSTGRPGSFEHFETPRGVFEHSPANLDFRAEGTLNANGIRGYGVKGMRVYDFGWQRAPKGWGDGAVSDMRLQLHATDPDALEPRLGTAQSKGCVRIPSSLNRLLDHHGVLDAAYDRLVRDGQTFWVLPQDRDPVADAGSYLVVVDSGRQERPEWSPAPARPRRRAPAAVPAPLPQPPKPTPPPPARIR